MTLPDQLLAVLRAEADAATAADAQAQVNKTMAAAVALAHQTAGVGISTGAYMVWPQSLSIDASHPSGNRPGGPARPSRSKAATAPRC